MNVEEFELVLLLLGIFVLIFIILNKRLTKDLPHPNLLITAFLMFLLSWISTNMEGFFFGDIFNLIEHISQLIGAFLIAVWCWKIFMNKEGDDALHSYD